MISLNGGALKIASRHCSWMMRAWHSDRYDDDDGRAVYTATFRYFREFLKNI